MIDYTPASKPLPSVLHYAQKRMAAAHAETGRYPSTWHELMAGGGFNGERVKVVANQEEDRPKPSEGARWTPQYVFHELRIVHADAHAFTIHAVDAQDRITWELTQRDQKARQLLPMICHREEIAMEGEDNEASAFLYYASWRIRIRNKRPRTWAESGIHWSLEDHYEDSEEAVAPSTAIDQWSPPGSAFTFHMKLDGTYYVLWSTNTRGLTNYIVDGLRSKPVEHKP